MPARTRRKAKQITSAATASSSSSSRQRQAPPPPPPVTKYPGVDLHVMQMWKSLSVVSLTATREAEEDLTSTEDWLRGVVKTYKERFGDKDDNTAASKVASEPTAATEVASEPCAKRARLSDDREVKAPLPSSHEDECEELTEDDINTMIVKELRVELRNRELDATGLKKVLQKRLLEHIKEKKAEKAKSPPPPSPFGKIIDMNNNKEMPIDLTSPTPTTEVQTIELTSDRKEPTSDTADHVKIVESNSSLQPMDICENDPNEGSAPKNLPQPDPTKIALPASPTISSPPKESSPMKPTNSTSIVEMDCVSQITMESNLTDSCKKKTLGNLVKATMTYFSPKKGKILKQTPAVDEFGKETAIGKDPAAMIVTHDDNGGTSDVRNDRPPGEIYVKSPRPSPQPEQTKQTSHLSDKKEQESINVKSIIKALNYDANKENNNHDEKKTAVTKNEGLKPAKQIDKSAKKNKTNNYGGSILAASRLLSTPAVTQSLHESSSGSITKSSSKKLHDKKKELAASRKKRLEEMRGKSKKAQQQQQEQHQANKTQVPKNNPLETNATAKSKFVVPALNKAHQPSSNTDSTPASSAKSTEERKKLLKAKMREQAAAELQKKLALNGQNKNTASTTLTQNHTKTKTPSQSTTMLAQNLTKTTTPSLSSATVMQNHTKTAAPSSQVKTSSSVQKYVQALNEKQKVFSNGTNAIVSNSTTAQAKKNDSPMETYEISDNEHSDSDESDSDSTDSEEKAQKAKKIPKWAKKENLTPALDRQFGKGPGRVDPDTIFGVIETCDLEKIFGDKKTRYTKRTSSGNWNNDKVTPMEKLIYSRQMGFQNA